jgi:DNA sulfur modification protein DndD
MITEIQIKKFGKWENKNFTFNKVNFIFGENESGKTTLFDAIVYGITKPSGTTSLGKDINSRYGRDKSDKQITIQGRIPESLDAEEFLNLHTLKAGGIRMNFEKANWLEKIKQQLFSGGFDPNSIVSDLTTRTRIHGNNPFTKSLTNIKLNIENVDNELNSLIQKKANLLNDEKNLTNESIARESTQQEIQRIEKEISAIQTEITREEESRKFQENKQIYKSIDEWKLARNSADQLKAFSKDRTFELDSIQNKINQLASDKENLKKNILANEMESNYQKNKLEVLKQNFEKENPIENLARNLQERILGFIRSPKMVIITKWNIAFIVFSSLCLLLGTVLISLEFSEKGFLFYIGIALAVLGLILLSFSRSEEKARDLKYDNQIVRDFKKEWKNAVDQNDIALDLDGCDTIEDIREVLIQYLSQRKNHTVLVQEKLEQIQKLDLDRLTLIKNESNFIAELALSEKSNKELFNELNVSSKEEYNSKRTQYQIEVEKFSSIETNLRERYKVKELEALLIEAKRNIESCKEKGIGEPTLNDSEFQARKILISQKENFKKELYAKEKSLFTNATEMKAKLEASLGPISKSIQESETKLFSLKTEKEELENQFEATKIALNIFEEISEEANDIFKTLAVEIAESSKNLFDEDRKILIEDLKGNISMQDKGNTMRHLDHLSLGTKDAFYIATKLAFCDKINPEMKLFMMDEPFLSLDESRETNALQVIRNYVQEKGWQLIILSKDRKLQALVQKIFVEDCNFIELS